jgi:hypothetical protein
MIKKDQRIKKKDTYEKEEERGNKKMGKYLSRSTVYLVFDSGAYVIRKEEKNHKVRIISKNIARESIWNRYVYIFEPIPEKNRL